MVFHWSWRDCKSPHISRTLLSILAVLNNAVVCTVSTRLPIFTYHNWYNRHFHVPQLFQFPSKVEVLISLFTFFQFYSVVSWDSEVDNFASSLFFLLISIRSGLLAEIRWSVCMSKALMSLCALFSRTGAGLCIYHLFVWSNLNFFHIFQWITLLTQSCLVLYSFCVNFLHSLTMWLMVSSLSPHSLHLLFCCVLSSLALIWLVLTALFWSAIIIIIIFIISPLKSKMDEIFFRYS